MIDRYLVAIIICHGSDNEARLSCPALNYPVSGTRSYPYRLSAKGLAPASPFIILDDTREAIPINLPINSKEIIHGSECGI